MRPHEIIREPSKSCLDLVYSSLHVESINTTLDVLDELLYSSNSSSSSFFSQMLRRKDGL